MVEGMQHHDVLQNALMDDLKMEMPLDKDVEFALARDALIAGNFTGFESIRQQWQNRSMREGKMGKPEALFWRMQRYAHLWPPPWLNSMHNDTNPVVFLDVAIRALDRSGSIEHEGRITIELLAHLVPRTAENFRAFCTGEVLDPRMYRAVGYKNTIFHRIVPGFLVQGGDFVKYDGTGCYSIYGGMRFADENLALPHVFGSVVMANAGPNTNGCQFFIVTCADAKFLDGKHVIVGHVLHGMDTVTKIAQVPTVGSDFRPLRKVVIEECGQLQGTGPDWEALGRPHSQT